MNIQTIQDLHKLVEESNYVIYDNNIITEVDIDNCSYYVECGDEESFDDTFDNKFLYAYESGDEEFLVDDLRKLIKQLEKSKKELQKLEQGKNCTILVLRDENHILTGEEIDELFSYETLESNINKIVIVDLKRIK